MNLLNRLFKQDVTPGQFRYLLVTYIKDVTEKIVRDLNRGKSPSLKNSSDFQTALGYLNTLEGRQYEPKDFFIKQGNTWVSIFSRSTPGQVDENDRFIEPDLDIVNILFERDLTPPQLHDKMLNFALRLTKKIIANDRDRVEEDETNLIKTVDLLNRLNTTDFTVKDFFKYENNSWKSNNPYSSM